MAERITKQFDPRMHSAEHIVNQTMIRMFARGRCFSAHLETRKSKLDFRFGRPLASSEIEELQARVNEIVLADMPLTEDLIAREKAEKDFSLDRLPEDAGDWVRIVRIGDYDSCPCIGPHVESTGEIGRFRVISTTYGEGVLRVRFKLDR